MAYLEGLGHARNGHKEWIPWTVILPNGHTLINILLNVKLIIYNLKSYLRR